MLFNVLVVEHSSVMQQFLKRAITMAGMPVWCKTTNNPGEARQLVDAGGLNLIIIDTNVLTPAESSLIERLSRSAEPQGTPYIVISADATASRAQSMLDAGASAYLTKPLDPALIRAEMKRVLEPRHAAQ
jgi:DNA-binding response OmpR family regulator